MLFIDVENSERILNNHLTFIIIKDKHSQDPSRYPFVTVMVVGMPNVGKSSLINSMRKIGVRKGKKDKDLILFFEMLIKFFWKIF
jgi:ribosome biogenesis GTPase A